MKFQGFSFQIFEASDLFVFCLFFYGRFVGGFVAKVIGGWYLGLVVLFFLFVIITSIQRLRNNPRQGKESY